MARFEVEIDPSGARSGAKVVKRNLDDILDKADRVVRSVGRLATKTQIAMRKAARSTFGFENALKRARKAGLALGIAITVAVTAGFRSAKALDSALGEASTLIEGTTEEMSLMRKEAQLMAQQFGGSSTQQVQAFYQAISAGADGVAGATVVLQAANKLAVGGVTDVTTAVDVLTSATNAYAASNLSSSDASDILFTGVKAGKTTVSELARTLGNVIPIASSVGIGFDEVVGAVAALTTQGQSTAIAVTGVRGALSAILKPTAEASKLAEKLGLDFSVAGLKAKGFGGFMQEVIEKTGGSQEALAELFGQIEGLNAVLAFAGGAGEKFNDTMAEMEIRTGSTDEAFKKINERLSQRLNKQLSILGVALERVGGIILSIVVPALELMTSATASVANMLITVKNVAVEVFGRLGQGALALQYKFVAMSANIKTAFLEAFQAILAGFDAVAGGISKGMNTLFGTDIDVGGSAGVLQNTIDYENIVAAQAGQMAAFYSAAFTAPLKSLMETKDALVGVGDEMASVESATEKAGNTGAKVFDDIAKGSEKAKKALEKVKNTAEKIADSIGNSIGDGLLSMVEGTKTVGEAFKDMARDIIRELYRVLAVQRIVSNAKRLIGAVFGFSDGAAFNGGAVTAFASGGVVNGPTTFPMNNGTGLMAEAGPEAIMPLSRGSDGKLGVKMNGGGGPSIHITQTFTGGVTREDLGHLAPKMIEMSREAVLDAMQRHTNGF